MRASVSPLSQSVGARTWRRFLRHRLAVASLLVLATLGVLAAAAPLVERALGVDAFTADLYQRLQGPSLAHPLGTDEIGRDHLVRLLYGGQVSLTVGLIAAFFSAVIGTVVGILAGYFGGRLDALLMRMTDSVIALPLLPLLIVLAAVDLEKLGLPAAIADSEDASLYRIVIIVSLVGWTTVALGARTDRILLTHILPNVVSPIVVATTLSVGNIILFESVLSFLGLGIQPPVASWGNMLSNAQDLVWSAPELATWPGIFIFVTVIAFNFLGDGLQDALDPRAGD
jgi:peptide/nickel transport system permease protein